jgi:hypothetical protein
VEGTEYWTHSTRTKACLLTFTNSTRRASNGRPGQEIEGNAPQAFTLRGQMGKADPLAPGELWGSVF